MKKYNEGYTLPFVLVVFLIISLVAVSILTVAVHNLHGQKESVKRMQAQYVAQGAIEAVNARLCAELDDDRTLSGTSPETTLATLLDEICKQIYKAESANKVYRDPEAEVSFTPDNNASPDGAFSCTFHMVSASGSVQVVSRIKLTGIIASSSQDMGATILYTFTNPQITFESYQIMTITGNGGGK